MYLADRRADRASRGASEPADGARAARVSRTVVLLGVVSLLTDVSSEAVTAVLPLYLTAVVGFSPLAYGFIDGIYQGVSAVVRIAAGKASDDRDRPKWVAFAGYALSAGSRIALLAGQGLALLTLVVTADRLGKGIRTAPRDAMIAAAAQPTAVARSFGVHRALDTAGAMVGPLAAFVVLWLLPGDYQAVFVVSFAFAAVGLAVLGLAVPDLRPRRAAALARDRGGQNAEQASPDHHGCRVRCRDCAFAEEFHKARATEPNPRPTLALLRLPELRRLLLVAGTLGLLTVGDGFLYLVLQRRSEVAVSWFPLLFVGTSTAYLLLSVPLGGLADRVGRTRVFLLGHVPLVAAFTVAGLGTGTAAVLLALALLGSYYAATDGVLAALAAQVVPADRRASGIATVQTVVALARFAAALGFGTLWGLIGPVPALLGIALVLTLVLPGAWRLLRSLDRPPQAGLGDV
jgi:MFS family permease